MKKSKGNKEEIKRKERAKEGLLREELRGGDESGMLVKTFWIARKKGKEKRVQEIKKN